MGRLLTVLGCLLSSIALGQADTQATDEPQLVHLNIVATDNHGAPINNLSSSDLQISDDGKPQQILYFRRIDRRLPPSPALAPNELANRTPATIPHATVILLDFMNERLATSAYAAHQLVHYLQSLESADYLYLYILTVDGRIYSVRGLDSEPQPGKAPWTKDSKRLIEQATNAVVHMRPVYLDVGTRIEWTFNALSNLGAALSRVPGRKNIVWVTDGVPIELGPVRSGTGDVLDFTPIIRQLSLAFERFQISIYPVQMIMLGSSQVLSDMPGTPSGDRVAAGMGSRQTLDEFAGITGGRPTSGKDIGGAVDQAMNDARMSYDLGYAPPEKNWNGKFHKLKVTSRAKGVRIQAKNGYYAWPQSKTQQAIAAIRPVAADPVDASEIGMRGAIASLAPNHSRVNVDIDRKDVVTIDEGESHKTSLTAAVLTYGAPGTGLTAIPSLIPIDAGPASPTIHFTRDIPLDPAVTAIRVIVYDGYGEKVGSLTFPQPHAPPSR